VKIIDFGLATKYLSDDHKNMTDRVGTLYSMSPQVLQGVYDYKCDLWSIGVIAYILLSGCQPFWGPPREMPWEKRRKIMMDRIMRCDYMKMTGPVWAQVSPEAKAFVKSLLQCDPEKRPTATEALQLPWMIQTANLKVEFSFPHHRQYCEAMELKRNARNVLGNKLSAAEIVKLKNILEEMDKKCDGYICLPDFCAALAKTRLGQDDIDSLLPQPEPDVCGSIDYVSLITDTLESKSRRESERMAAALSSADSTNTGKISKNQIYSTLHDVVPDDLLGTVLESIDEDDGSVFSIQQVMDLAEKEHTDAINMLLTPGKESKSNDEDAESSLVTPKDVIVPGGRNDENEKPKYTYDTATGSLHKCDA